MKTMKQASFLLASAVALACQAAAAEAPNDTGLGEIIVTAEKRASTVQDTPISMTAMSGEQLAANGIAGVTGLALEVPGISMRTSGPGQSELEMRGLSSSGGSSPTVGFYLNDYPLTPPAAAVVGKVVIDPDLYDLARVEVLRGPQGTLYGSGSMGGTIKLVTAEPNLTRFEGSANLTVSDTDGGGFNRGVNAMVNMPIVTDRVALRLVGTSKYNDGWISRDVVTPFPLPVNAGPCGAGWPGCDRGTIPGNGTTTVIPKVNWERLIGGRAELLAKVTDDVKVSVLAMHQKITSGGYSEYDSPPDTALAHYQPFDIAEPFSDEFSLLGATVSWKLGFADLTSATAYYSREERQTQDSSEAVYSVLNLYGFSDQGYTPIGFSENDWTRQFSQEIRLASNGDGRLQWIGGVYYSHFTSIFEEVNQSPAIADYSYGGAAANPNGILYQAHNPYHMDQYAVFGELNWTLTDRLKLTTGLRWYRFDTNVDEESSGIATASGNATPTLSNFKASSSGFNPKVTLSYESENRKLTAYTTAARGFRPGGVNQQIPTGIGCNLTAETYGPDNTWNYEVGEKSKLFDNRITLNADYYYIRWGDVQQLLNQGCGYPLTQNAGVAAAYGPEIELAAKLNNSWTVSLSGAHTHSALSSVNPALTAANSAFVPGLPILNIPDTTVSGSLNYSTAISDNLRLTARASGSYVGSSTDISYTYGTLDPYKIYGLRIGLMSDRYSVSVFADNLTNTHAKLGINTTSFDWVIPSLTRVATNVPRTIGLDLRVQF